MTPYERVCREKCIGCRRIGYLGGNQHWNVDEMKWEDCQSPTLAEFAEQQWNRAEKAEDEVAELFKRFDNAMHLLYSQGFRRFNPDHPIWKQWDESREKHAHA